jgi:DNA-binding transcriptional LysR family regulator
VIEWDRLRVFAAVADHGSVGAAAAALHITGPAVTQQLRKLERETGHRLVEPDGRGIRLTAAGHVLAGYAATVAVAVADAGRDLAALRDEAVGPLRVGAVASALRALLPGALRALATDHPRLVPTVRDGEVVELLPALRSRDLDAVLLESWDDLPARIPPGVRMHRVATEEALAVLPSGHELAGRDRADLAALAGQVWISCPAGTESHEALVQILRESGVEPDVRYRAADFTTHVRLVAAGLAVALVPRGALDPLPDGVVVQRCDPPVHRTLAVAVREDDDTPGRRAFRDAVVRAARDLGWSRDPAAVPA